jgi:hypothetical protein
VTLPVRRDKLPGGYVSLLRAAFSFEQKQMFRYNGSDIRRNDIQIYRR